MPTSSRSNSRSPSRSPSRKDSRDRSYSDEYSDYSDATFISDNESIRKPNKIKSQPAKNSNLTKKNVNKKYGNKGGGKGGAGGGRTSKASKMTGNNTNREGDYVTRRMLSARRLKINELRNEVESLTQQLQEVQQENKTLRRQKTLQDKALDKYEYQENDMSSILQRHAEEVRILKEQIRRQKEKQQKTEGKLKDAELEQSKAQRQVKKLKELVDKKDLAERDDMARKMTSMESELDDSRKRIAELEKYIANLQKNHKHELGITRARHKEDIRKLQELQEINSRLETALREKEKELDVRNIYAQRVMKPPHKLNSSVNSVRSTPAPSQRGRGSVPQSPHEERRRRKEKSQTQAIPQKEPVNSTTHKKNTAVLNEVKALPAPPTRASPPISVSAEHGAGPAANWQPAFLTQSTSQTYMTAYMPAKEEQRVEEKEQADWQAERESMKREAERRSQEEEHRRQEQQDKQREQDRQHEQDRQQDRQQEEEWKRQDLRRQEQEEEERRKREEKERHEAEERARREQERLQREKEERERREQEERMRRAREEAERLANDKAEQERQRQKALLLAKMKEIDESNNKNTIQSSPSHRNYSFTKPVENMHNGLPAYEDQGSPARMRNRRRSNDSDSDLGYKPSFSSDKRSSVAKVKPSFLTDNDSDNSPKHTVKNNAKKSNLMVDLFGNDTSSSNKKEKDDLFGGFKPSRPTERRRGEDPGASLFGVVNEDDGRGSGNLLPRRHRQNPTTLHNRPTINAVDDIDDDLEEVVL